MPINGKTPLVRRKRTTSVSVLSASETRAISLMAASAKSMGLPMDFDEVRVAVTNPYETTTLGWLSKRDLHRQRVLAGKADLE
jgi:hypothetical protein